MRSPTRNTATAAGALAVLTAALLCTAPPTTAPDDSRTTTAHLLTDRHPAPPETQGATRPPGSTAYGPPAPARILWRPQGSTSYDAVPQARTVSYGDSDRAVTPTPATTPSPPPHTAPAAGTHTVSRLDAGLGWWPYALAVGLLIGLVLPSTPPDKDARGRRGRCSARG